jgi:hypothetical protein
MKYTFANVTLLGIRPQGKRKLLLPIDPFGVKAANVH